MTALQHDDQSVDLFSHLEELRTRMLYALLAAGLGIAVGWWLYPLVYQWVAAPVVASVQAHGGVVFTQYPGEAFFIRVKLAVALGVVLASPFVVWQLWAFVRPGLTRRERRAVAPVLPLISVLFLLGVGVAYLLMPQVMAFFQGYVPLEVSANVSFEQSVSFPLKIMLAFGLAFQLPSVLLGLVWLGVLEAAALLRQWRLAMVVLGVLAAVITPTGDPLNWSLMMAPLVLLYFGTIWVANRIRRPGDAGSAGREGEES